MTQDTQDNTLNMLSSTVDLKSEAFIRLLETIPAIIVVLDEKNAPVLVSQYFDREFCGDTSAVALSQLKSVELSLRKNITWVDVALSLSSTVSCVFKAVHVSVNELEGGGSLILALPLPKAEHDAPPAPGDNASTGHLAFKDALTGVANRALFFDRLEKVLSSAKRNRHHFALMLIDLDHFSDFNDQYGCEIGDRYLKFVAANISSIVREADTVARFSDDKFMVVLDRVSEATKIESVVEKLMDSAFSTMALDDGREVECTASIGISLFPKDGYTVEKIIQQVDKAVSYAKESGKNQHHFYTKEVTKSLANYLLLENDLRGAVSNNELMLFYQPQVDIVSGRIVGLEVLCRWHHPTRGVLSPGYFIPLAEESGLIKELGGWVLSRGCEAFQRWREKGVNFGKLSVNVSARQFRDGGFVSFVDSVLAASGLPEGCLELELTESATMENPAQGCDILNALINRGVSVALDDFGTGYSSLAYLQRFPINKLKIDKAFIDGVGKDKKMSATVKSIIDLGKNMEMDVIAEGVEAKDQLTWLRLNGCHLVQGDFYAGGLSETELLSLSKSGDVVASSDDTFSFR